MQEKESVERVSYSQLDMFVQMLTAGGCLAWAILPVITLSSIFPPY